MKLMMNMPVIHFIFNFPKGVIFVRYFPTHEIWYNIKEEEEQKLSEVDKYLLRSILGAPSKTTKEALFLESGCVPIKYILKMRHILRRPKDELIRKFYEAQKCKLSKGDWAQTVQENLQELAIHFDDQKISQMSKQRFKKMLKKKIQYAAFNFLMTKKNLHSKMADVEY